MSSWIKWQNQTSRRSLNTWEIKGYYWVQCFFFYPLSVTILIHREATNSRAQKPETPCDQNLVKHLCSIVNPPRLKRYWVKRKLVNRQVVAKYLMMNFNQSCRVLFITWRHGRHIGARRQGPCLKKTVCIHDLPKFHILLLDLLSFCSCFSSSYWWQMLYLCWE